MIISYLGIIYAASLILTYFFLIIGWIIKKNKPGKNKNELSPPVSVLIAARNEEHNIKKCLQSLQNLNYPAHLTEILIGNDMSDDKTREIAIQFVKTDSRFKLIDITENLNNTKGKANVLAHLTKKAKGDFFFITDADIEVSPHWITGMLSPFKKENGIVTGFTYTKKENLTGIMQNIEWTNALGILKVFADFNQPLSTMGNNMMISRTAYFETGGYENIPFSVTEDFELFKQVKKKGYIPIQLINFEVLCTSAPAKNLSAYLNQRKRWLTGVWQSPWYVKVLVISVLIYFPLLIIFLILFPVITFILFLCKNILQIIFINLIKKKLKQKLTFLDIFIFDIYFAFFSFASLLFTLAKNEVEWKGRKYNQ